MIQHAALRIFDRAATGLSQSLRSLAESELLETDVWSQGTDVRLREDARFRATPWGRYILADQFLANEFVFESLQNGNSGPMATKDALEELRDTTGRQCIICPGDDRIILRDGIVTLANKYLSKQPLIEDEIGELEKYTTHLPIHTLKAAAASVPAGEWGPAGQETAVNTLGWMQVSLSGQKLNREMFVAQIQGQSMDDGRSGLIDQAYAVFEFWPKGTRQGKIVLVRGAFTDPETGTYAVKKYIADKRDEHGEHRRITLVSLNSDEQRYPDIILTPESDDDLAVVASFVTPLSPSQYKRKPKTRVPKGRRDLNTEDGRNRIAQRLTKASSRVFDGEPDIDEADHKEIKPRARFVCLDFESGGLNIETTPLNQLPSFVKKLQITTNGEPQTVLASNLRNRVWRTPVRASSSDYLWSAPGFENELDQDLAHWKLAGLDGETAYAFRIDASGFGQHIRNQSLALAQAYRVLVPPSLETVELPEAQTSQLNDGWRLWEFKLPSTLTIPWRDQLQTLGLSIGKSAPDVRWVLNTPVSYFAAPSGEHFPVFNQKFAPTVRIEGVSTNVDGECAAFILAGEKLIPMMLPAGDQWTLQLDGLTEGRYILEVTHRRTRVQSVRLPFVVSFDSGPLMSSAVQLRFDSQLIAPDDAGFATLESDLTDLNGEGDCEMTGPSLWPYAQFWESETRRYLDTSYVDAVGSLDVESLAELSRESRERNRIGNLILDFSELGFFELRHTRRDEPSELLNELAKATVDKLANVEAMSGQFQLLRSMWIDSLLERLGYQVQDVVEELLKFAPTGVSAILLYERCRSGSRITKQLSTVLVLTSTSSDWNSFDTGSVHEFADILCEQVDVRQAFITDGLRWTRHRQGKRVHARVWDLRDLGTEEANSEFEHFLFDFAAGV